MKYLLLIVVLVVGQTIVSPGQDGLRRLQAKIPVRLVQPEVATDLAGRYSGQSPELEKRVGPFLSGEDLYLFPDGTYIYCEWADVMPETVYDKGRWTAAGAVLQVVSDADIRWSPNLDRRHVIVRRAGRPAEVLLVGLARQLPHFEQEAAGDPELMLLIVGMLRIAVLDAKTAPALKDRLMKKAWRPEFFRTSEPSNPAMEPTAPMQSSAPRLIAKR